MPYRWHYISRDGFVPDEAIHRHIFDFAARDFPKLHEAFKADGVLHNDNVFLFFSTESQLNTYNWDRYKIPVFVAIVSPVPPPIKIGIKSQQMMNNEGLDFFAMEHVDIDFEEIDMEIMDVEEIIEMENTDWVWFQYKHQSEGSTDFSMLRPLDRKCDRVLDHNDFVVYFNNPFKAEPFVEIVYQTETQPIRYDFYWEEDGEPEDFTSALITFGMLAGHHRDSFQELVRAKAEEAKRAYHEALQAQEKLIAQGINAADFEKMRFYKFYPSIPTISFAQHAFINKYFGDAHQVFG